jgi:hypothetical protein
MHHSRAHSSAVGLCLLALVGLISACTPSSRSNVAKPPTSLPAKSAAGFLFQDRNGNGVRDSDEQLLAGWTVRMYGSGPLALVTTTTGKDGSFRFDNVDAVPGSTAVEFSPVFEGPAQAGLPNDTGIRQTVKVTLGRYAGAIAVRSYRECLTVADCPSLQLPDLTPVLTGSVPASAQYPGPKAWYLDTKTEPGHVLMRFGTSTLNKGPGILDLIGENPNSDGTQPVVQRVFGDGVVYIKPAGNFEYDPEHHHIHVANFEDYQLRSLDGAKVIATGNKVSFCLTDVLTYSVNTKPDPALHLDIPPFQCGSAEQGINAGFADYYGPTLENQWIDVTHVPSGRYQIAITADPDHLFLETNKNNNTASFDITYKNPSMK